MHSEQLQEIRLQVQENLADESRNDLRTTKNRRSAECAECARLHQCHNTSRMLTQQQTAKILHSRNQFSRFRAKIRHKLQDQASERSRSVKRRPNASGVTISTNRMHLDNRFAFRVHKFSLRCNAAKEAEPHKLKALLLCWKRRRSPKTPRLASHWLSVK